MSRIAKQKALPYGAKESHSKIKYGKNLSFPHAKIQTLQPMTLLKISWQRDSLNIRHSDSTPYLFIAHPNQYSIR
jgi:hypothetical protein